MVLHDVARSDATPSTPFVGRERELASVREAVDRAARGEPSLVAITGEAGVGKSALLREVLAALPRSVSIAVAVADEHDADLTYGVLDQLTRAMGQRSAAEVIAAGADVLAAGSALLAQLGSMDADGPVVVVIEDVHWSDRGSLDALAFAWRRLVRDPIAVVMTCRTSDGAAVPPTVQRLLDDGRAELVALERFAPDDVAQLARRLGKPVSPRIARALIAHTGGLPLHVRTLLEDLTPSHLSVGDPLLLPQPRSFDAAIDDRISQLSAPATALVEAAAVLASAAPLGQLADLAAVDEPEVVAAEAARAGLLRLPRPGDPTVAFTHPLLRAATYEQMPLPRRAELHRRAAAAARDERTALRHRVAASIGADDELAGDLVAFAERRAEEGSFDAAIGAFVAAHRVATPSPEAQELLLRAAELMISSGAGERAASVVADVDPNHRSPRRMYLSGVLALFDGRTVEGEHLLADAWRMCGPDDRDVAGHVASSLAALYVNQGRVEDTVTWTARARELAVPNDPSTSLSTTVHAMSLALLGRYDDALAAVGRLPGTVVHPRPEQVDEVLARGVIALWRGDLFAARADLSAVVAVSREQGPAPAASMGLYYLADAELRLGQLDDSAVHGELAVVLANEAGLGWTAAIAHAAAASPLTLRGDWEAASGHVAAARAAAERLGDPAASLWTAVAACRLRWARGDRDARDELDGLWPIRHAAGLDQLGIQPWLAVYTEAVLLGTDAARIEEVIAELDARLAATPMPGPLAVAGRARAALLSAGGDHRGAAETLRATLAALDGSALPEQPFERALVELALGRALRRSGRRRAAVEQLQSAHHSFAAIGARPWLAACEAELAACGVNAGDRPGRRVSAALTPQELAVARLVARGLTNREVAAELIVSVKTVEYHLGNLYPKLGVRSRGGVAAALGAN